MANAEACGLCATFQSKPKPATCTIKTNQSAGATGQKEHQLEVDGE